MNLKYKYVALTMSAILMTHGSRTATTIQTQFILQVYMQFGLTTLKIDTFFKNEYDF